MVRFWTYKGELIYCENGGYPGIMQIFADTEPGYNIYKNNYIVPEASPDIRQLTCKVGIYKGHDYQYNVHTVLFKVNGA